jgi:hypothetical protein
MRSPLGERTLKGYQICLSTYAPRVFTAVQAAGIQASTPVGRVVQDVEQCADAVHNSPDGIHDSRHYVRSAVAGTAPPFSTLIHLWIAPLRTMTASTIKIELQIVSTQPSV